MLHDPAHTVLLGHDLHGRSPRGGLDPAQVRAHPTNPTAGSVPHDDHTTGTIPTKNPTQKTKPPQTVQLRPDAPTRSGRCRSGTGPAAPPLRWSMQSADQRDGRSHSAAMGQADALRPIAPPAPGPRGPRRRLPGAPGPLGGGAGPVAGDRPEPPRPDPGRAGSRGQPPAPSPTRRKHTPGRSGSARAPRRQPDRAAPGSSGRFPVAGMILIPPWIQTLHHTQDDPVLLGAGFQGKGTQVRDWSVRAATGGMAGMRACSRSVMAAASFWS